MASYAIAIVAQPVRRHACDDGADQVDEIMQAPGVSIGGNAGPQPPEEGIKRGVDGGTGAAAEKRGCAPSGEDQQLVAHGEQCRHHRRLASRR